MFGKSDDKSRQEVEEIVKRFNLEMLPENEKEAIVSMAKDRTLVSLYPGGVENAAFMKTTVYQNWMLLSELSRLNANIEKLLNK